MKIMKRNGTEAAFDAQKIVVAISKARDEAACGDLSDEQIHTIAGEIKGRCEGLGYAVHVEDIQDMVEHKLIEYTEIIDCEIYGNTAGKWGSDIHSAYDTVIIRYYECGSPHLEKVYTDS